MLGWFAETTLVASVLAVVAALAGRVRPIGPTARHVLWLAVLVKLMTPPLVSWPWAVPWSHLDWPVLSQRAEPVRDAARDDCAEDRTASPVAFSGPSVCEVSDAPPEISASPSYPASPALPATSGVSGAAVERGLIVAWLVVTGLLGAGQAWRILRFRRRLRLAVPAPDDLVAEAERIAAAVRRPGSRAPGRPRPGHADALVPGPAHDPAPRAPGRGLRRRPLARDPGPRAGPPPPRRPLGQPARAARRLALVVEPPLLAHPRPARRRGRAGLRCLGGRDLARGPHRLRRDPLRHRFRTVPRRLPGARVGRRRSGPLTGEKVDHDPARTRPLPALPAGPAGRRAPLPLRAAVLVGDRHPGRRSRRETNSGDHDRAAHPGLARDRRR